MDPVGYSLKKLKDEKGLRKPRAPTQFVRPTHEDPLKFVSNPKRKRRLQKSATLDHQDERTITPPDGIRYHYQHRDRSAIVAHAFNRQIALERNLVERINRIIAVQEERF
jgi:hypothetical protein